MYGGATRRLKMSEQQSTENKEQKPEKKVQAVVVRIDDKGLFSFKNHNELNNAASMAVQLSLVPAKLVEAGGKVAAAAALMMCKQFGLPMKAMNEMGWIEGNLTVYGSLYWALAERHPEFGEHEMFWIDENGEQILAVNKNLKSKVWAAILRIKKKNSTVWNEYSFTMEDAEKAGLYPPMKNEYVNKQKTGKKILNENSPWHKYTKDMLMHKVKKRALDANYAAALNGAIYHEDAYEHLSQSRDVTPSPDKDAHNDLANTFEGDENGEQ